jgi:diguanylate cyclase (GGDEF)-like protein/PAS domain S-box-containing protein
MGGDRVMNSERQQRALVELSAQALGRLSQRAFVDLAASEVADSVDAIGVWIVQLLADGEWVLRAAVGLAEDTVGGEPVGGANSLSGYALRSGGPVICDDLLNEGRFRPTVGLVEHGARSAVSVLIGSAESPYGVLGASAADRRAFSAADVMFLETVANLIAATVPRLEQRDLFDATLEAAGSPIVVLDANWRIVRFNRQSELLSGYQEADVLGREYDFLVPEGERHDVRATLESADATVPVTQANHWSTKDGELRLIRWSNAALVDARGRRTHVIAIGIDVTEQRLAERARERLAEIVEASEDAILSLSRDGVIESWNRGAEHLYGYTAEEAIGQSMFELIVADERLMRQQMVARVLGGSSVERFEARDRRKDGSIIDVAITDSPIRDSDGTIVGVARVARDVTERKRLERELKFYADHDPLTGLFNRRRFAEELSEQIAQAARYGQTTGLLVGDVDNFKHVNDSLGHNAGDTVIQRIARTLAARLRETDVLARLGGDEFAVLLPHTGEKQAALVAESLRQAVHDDQLAVDLTRVTISFGVTIIDGAQLDPDDALVAADLAMYEAKQRGRDRVVTARAGAQQQRAEQALQSAARIRRALYEQQFELYAQPIVELSTSEPHHHELLLRLCDNGNVVLPGTFIGTAERHGLIKEIDRWVITRAVGLIAERTESEPRFAVNLSGASVGDPAQHSFIERSVDERGIDPARIIFEVTETAAIADLDAARRLVACLHEIGCSVALDNFGSGFGSFAYLRYLPIDYLKIDGHFIRQLPGSIEERLLVKAIVDVARGLGKRTVAEHAGSDAAIAVLRELGVDFAQGFHLGEPKPLQPVA